MTRSLVLHLGDHKTGSTAIQRALADHAWQGAPGGPEIFYTAKGNHNTLAQTLLPDAPAQQQRRRFANHAARIAASGAGIAVLSAEEFERVNPEAVATMLRQHFPEHADSARLIAYVRPHAERLVSSYAERVKQGYFLGSLEELYAKVGTTPLLRYTPRFRKWRAVFGDRFELRPMIRAGLHNGCVVQDFLRYTLEGAPFTLTRPVESNRSLSLEDLAMMRALQSVLGQGRTPPAKGQNAIGWQFATILGGLEGGGGTKLRAHRSLIAQLQQDCRKDAETLDAEFFAGHPLGQPMTQALDRAGADALEAPQSLDLDACFPPDEAHRLRAWISLLHRMYLHDPEIWPGHLRHIRPQEDAGPDAGQDGDAAQD